MEKAGTRNAEAIAFLAFAKMLAIVFFARRIYEDPHNLGLLIWRPVPIEPVTAPGAKNIKKCMESQPKRLTKQEKLDIYSQ